MYCFRSNFVPTIERITWHGPGGRVPKRPGMEEVTAAFYEAAGEPSLLQPALRSLADLFTPTWITHFFVGNKDVTDVPLSLVSHDAIQPAAEQYANYYGAIDPRVAVFSRNPVGQAFFCHHLFDERYVAKSEFYADFLIPAGGRFLMATKLAETETYSAILGNRIATRDRDRSTPRTKPFFGALCRILRSGPRLFMKLREASVGQGRVISALDQLSKAIIVVKRDGKIMMANSTAGDSFARRDGPENQEWKNRSDNTSRDRGTAETYS